MTFVSLRFGYNQTEDDVYHHRGAYGSQRQQHIDDANHRRVQPQVLADTCTHAANHAPLTRPGKSFDHIHRNLYRGQTRPGMQARFRIGRAETSPTSAIYCKDRTKQG